MVKTEVIGTYEGADVKEFTISDGGLSVSVMEYGATIHRIMFGGVDCVAGYDGLDGYINGGSYQGATVGRYANRIAAAKFTMDGKEYRVGMNNGTNSLHGGFTGFSHRMFKGEQVSDNAVKFSIFSPDGEGGYPGNLDTSVTFTVEGDTLRLYYEAESDKDTPINLTNHAYFNLGSKDNLTTVLKINADRITEVDGELIPTGKYIDVEGTPFDFRTAKPIGRDIAGDHPQIKAGGGYDHNFVLGSPGVFKKDAAVAYCPESGITMTCSTDRPGVQLYASCMLDEPCGKGGVPLSKFYAFCLETQVFANTPNRPEFPNCILKAGEKFNSVTEYSFKK